MIFPLLRRTLAVFLFPMFASLLLSGLACAQEDSVPAAPVGV